MLAVKNDRPYNIGIGERACEPVNGFVSPTKEVNEMLKNNK